MGGELKGKQVEEEKRGARSMVPVLVSRFAKIRVLFWDRHHELIKNSVSAVERL